jgi:hypothetical protein
VEAELVAAEVRLRRTCGDDQAVVRELPGTVEQPAFDEAALEVDALDRREDDLGVALMAKDVQERRRDVSLRQHSRRDLIEQRLEEMVRLPVDDRDVDRSSPQRLRGGQAAEAAPYDHGLVASRHRSASSS